MKINLIKIFTAVMIITVLTNCAKEEPSTNNQNSTSQSLEFLPWEIDLTIGGDRYHWKSNEYSNSAYVSLAPTLNTIGFTGLNKLSKNFISGDEIRGSITVPELPKTGIQKATFYLADPYLTYDSIQINVIDWGEKYTQELQNSKFVWVGGRPGEITISKQIIMISKSGSVSDQVPTELSGKLIFYRTL